MKLASLAALVLLCRLAAVAQRQTVPDAVLEDFSNIVTVQDTGFDDFSGNMGLVNKDNKPYGSWTFGRSTGRPAVTFRWDFAGQADQAANAGAFFSLFGLTDTKVTYDRRTVVTERFNEHSLNLDRVDGALAEPGGDRKYLSLGISVLYQGSQPLDLRLELKDVNGGGRFTRKHLIPSAQRQSLQWDFRGSFAGMSVDLDLKQAKVFSFVVERSNQADGIRNPDTGLLVVDRIWFVPDRAEAEPASDADLLDLSGRRSCQYFLDWSSRKSASLGIPQDRSTFADLLTTGGIGFALPCYAIAAERGWISRPDAAARTLAVVRLVADSRLFCADPVGCIGYRGWLYHFLGPDGRRKQNFDFPETPAREDRNTVEVSAIDTRLALMGALTAQSYFGQDTSDERDIRTLAQQFYDNVDWNFMLDPASRRFFLGWKPTEDRDDSQAAFLYPDRENKGQYSGTAKTPTVLDYYTDEGFLVTLLALGSQKQTVGADVHCAWSRQRDDSGLVRTWPGSLFTYFFARAFLATEQFALRPCPDEPAVDWLANSRRAFLAAIQAMAAGAWGISAAEGPTDEYHAYGLPALALDPKPQGDGTVTYYAMLSAAGFGDDLRARTVEALRAGWGRGHWHHRFALPDTFHEDALQAFPAAIPVQVPAAAGAGDGQPMSRPDASTGTTIWLHAGESRSIPVSIARPGIHVLKFRTSNDNDNNRPLETVSIFVDGFLAGTFQPPDTGDTGQGWNVFSISSLPDNADLLAGAHTVRLDVGGGHGYGVEIDWVRLEPQPTGPRPWVQRARFAIDEGPVGLHLENARSGLVWRLIGSNSNVKRAIDRLHPVATVSAASLKAGGAIAPESIASTFGQNLASGTLPAPTGQPPEDLGGTRLRIRDAKGAIRQANLFFVSSGQINWVTPTGLAAGDSTVTITNPNADSATGTVRIEPVSPGLFAAGGSGTGIAAASILRVKADGSQSAEPVTGIDFGADGDQLYLILYGTGIRGVSSPSSVGLAVGAERIPVLYAGRQGGFQGLDQVNAGPLPRSLAGKGLVDVRLTLDGNVANTVSLQFR